MAGPVTMNPATNHSEETSDEEQVHRWVNAVLNGRTESFSRIVDTYKDRLFLFQLKGVKSREEAEDLTQETFIKIYKNLSRYDSNKSFVTWIYTIAYRLRIDHGRKTAGKQREMELDPESNMLAQPPSKQPDHLAIQREQVQLIRSFLKTRDSEKQTIFHLFYHEHLSLNEISSITNRPVSTVGTILHRLKREIKNHLLELEKPGGRDR